MSDITKTTDLEYVCDRCKHFAGGQLCEAFPDGIPLDVLNGSNDHASQIEGDNGIQFEQEKEA